jgi:Zn-dependent metalloprotease
MPLCTRTALRLELLIVAGLLLTFSACFPQKPQALPADTVIQIGPAGTPRMIKGSHLAADLESSAAYSAALRGEDFGEMARLFLAHRSDLFKLADPKTDLRLMDVQPDSLGHHHAKFQQVVDNIPVWQKTLSVHFDPQDRLYRVDGDYLPTPLEVDTQPILSEVQARAKALSGIAGTGGSWKVESAELIVYAGAGNAPRLAYRFTVAKGLANREDRIVAADTGQMLKRLSRIHQ